MDDLQPRIESHLGMNLGSLCLGLLGLPLAFPSIFMFAVAVGPTLAAIGVHHALRARRLDGKQVGEAEDAAERAQHYGILSLSVNGIVVTIFLFGLWFARGNTP